MRIEIIATTVNLLLSLLGIAFYVLARLTLFAEALTALRRLPRGIRCSRVDCPLTPYVTDLPLEHIDPILTWISGEFLYHARISHVCLVKRFV